MGNIIKVSSANYKMLRNVSSKSQIIKLCLVCTLIAHLSCEWNKKLYVTVSMLRFVEYDIEEEDSHNIDYIIAIDMRLQNISSSSSSLSQGKSKRNLTETNTDLATILII